GAGRAAGGPAGRDGYHPVRPRDCREGGGVAAEGWSRGAGGAGGRVGRLAPRSRPPAGPRTANRIGPGRRTARPLLRPRLPLLAAAFTRPSPRPRRLRAHVAAPRRHLGRFTLAAPAPAARHPPVPDLHGPARHAVPARRG